MFLTKAALAGGKPVDLRTEIVELIQKVREALAEHRGAEVSIERAVIAIFRHRRGDEPSEQVQAALDSLGVPVEEVIEKLDRLATYLIQIADRIEPLVLPLGNAGEHLSLPLKFSAQSQPMAVGDIGFALGNEAGTELTVASFLANSAPDGWAGPIPAGAAVQSLSVSGKIGFWGSASGAFGHGALTFASSMQGSGRINLYHQYSAATSRAAALVNSSDAWAPPWDLAALDDTLQPVQRDGGTLGLRRVHIQGSGRMTLGGGVTVGQAIGVSARDRGALDARSLSASARVDASLDFSLTRDGAFTYRIEKDADGLIHVSVAKSAASDHSRSINLGADIDVTGLDAVASTYLDRFFDDPAGLMETLSPWLSPGDRLADVLEAGDWRHPVVEKLGKLLLGDASAAELNDAATRKLEAKLRGLLNERVPFWGEPSADVADQLIGAVV
ncbi:MAG: hypothetical protein AAFR44_01775, partial [Pseudomonadota bacterium]